jgi:hypothetical protein
MPGRPKVLPDDLYADRGYDSESTRAMLQWLGIESYIAKRKTTHGSGLGHVSDRWSSRRFAASRDHGWGWCDTTGWR